MAAPGWPVELTEGNIQLRPLRLRDATSWLDVRRRNAAWLRPWEATPAGAETLPRDGYAAFTAMVRTLRRSATNGTALPFVIFYNEQLVGQVTIGNIVRGSLNSGYAGYWVDQRVAGRGIMPTALALVVDHCFGPAQLHRVEANVRPENTASRRVVQKLGFREEGLRRRYLHISGGYRDHLCYALTVEDAPEGVLARWRATRMSLRHTDDGA